MAKITTSQKSGSVGPSTFQTSRHGLIERQRVKPIDPKTLAQLTQRNIIVGVSSAWPGLTDEQRAGWAALAAQLPDDLTGQQLHVSVNAIRARCGLPSLVEAPPPPGFGILVCTGLVVDDTPLVKLTQVSDTGAPDRFLIEACPPLSPGIQCVKKLFRHLAVVPGHAAPAADLDVTAAYVERFGAPPVGRRVHLRITALKEGFKGTPLQFRTLVAAHPC